MNCDICSEWVKSVYFDLKHNVGGHKSCIKSYRPDYRIAGKTFDTVIIDDIIPNAYCDMCAAEVRDTCICDKGNQ